jgi:hypothetical protein
VTGLYQDVSATAVTLSRGTFFAFNPRFTTTQGFYLGLQNRGQLSNGSVVDRSALTGLFGVSASTMRNLQPAICNSAADFALPGISCAIPYSWYTGPQWRLLVDAIPSTDSGWCPSSTHLAFGSAANCMVYVLLVAPTSNPQSKTQIAAWSIDTRTFGVPGNAYSFLEVFSGGVPCNAGSPSGYFVIPFKLFGSSQFAPWLTQGSDSAVGCPAPRWWFDWVVQRITY